MTIKQVRHTIGLLPRGERVFHQLRVIVADVSRHLPSDECRFHERLVFRGEFHLSHSQPFVLAIEFIHLKDVLSAAHQVTGLVDDTRFAQFQQFPRFAQRNFLFPLVAARSRFIGCTLDGEKSPFIADALLMYPCTIRLCAYACGLYSPVTRNFRSISCGMSFPVILSAPVRVSHKHGDDQYNGYYSHRHHHFLGLLLFLLAVHCFLFTFSHGVFYSLEFNDEQSKKKFGKNANEREKIYSPLPANSIR